MLEMLFVVSAAFLGDICAPISGLNCEGQDIGNVHNLSTHPVVDSAAACCTFCKVTKGCVAWTWNHKSNHRCNPKVGCSHPRREHPNGDVSGSSAPIPPGPHPTPAPSPHFYPFRNISLSWAERVNDLVTRLTFAEKVGFLATHPPAVGRLGIRPYSYETECDSGACGGSGGRIFYNACRGPCTTDNLTAFPQSVGMGATFNRSLVCLEGRVIGTELRAIAAANFRAGSGNELGLSCFSPMINIVRDPFWNRNSEGYSEDPFLTGELAHAVVSGMQGDDPRYIQVVAGCKHFVPYVSGCPRKTWRTQTCTYTRAREHTTLRH